MATPLTQDEEFAVAFKDPVFKLHLMVVVVTVERDLKLVEAEALTLLSIPFGFFDFADHVIHRRLLIRIR
jgi:hypothetical protein